MYDTFHDCVHSTLFYERRFAYAAQPSIVFVSSFARSFKCATIVCSESCWYRRHHVQRVLFAAGRLARDHVRSVLVLAPPLSHVPLRALKIKNGHSYLSKREYVFDRWPSSRDERPAKESEDSYNNVFRQ
jgi:hypothetical protein